MSLRKIEGTKWVGKRCNSTEHNPPMHINLEPGTYEHTCPVCGAKRIFTVPDVSYGELR